MASRRSSRRQAAAGVDETGRGTGQRRRRVGEELRHLLSEVLRGGACRDPALREANITVTEVRLSPDLRNADVYVMPLGGANAAEIVAGLRRSTSFLRSQIAREVSLRYVPALLFELDTTFDQADRISALLMLPEVERDLHPQTADAVNDDDAV